MSILREQYNKEYLPELMKRRGYKNLMEAPRLQKIVLSTGIGSDQDRDVFDEAMAMLSSVTGQRPVITKAKNSIAGFKLREKTNVGCCVTLRGDRMYDFFYRLVNIALPRVRDFRGVSANSFDGSGNYSMGISDQSIFTEVILDKMKHTIGMNVTIVTSAETDEEARELMTMMGFPFAH